MSLQQIAFNATTKVAKIQMPGDAPGSGFVDLGDFDHSDPVDSMGADSPMVSHTLYHHVQAACDQVGQTNMSVVDIQVKPVTRVSVTPATVAMEPDDTQQLTVAVVPVDASIRYVVYTSDNPAVATVSNTGVVTGIADGQANITVTTVDGGFIDTCEVTVNAD